MYSYGHCCGRIRPFHCSLLSRTQPASRERSAKLVPRANTERRDSRSSAAPGRPESPQASYPLTPGKLTQTLTHRRLSTNSHVQSTTTLARSSIVASKPHKYRPSGVPMRSQNTRPRRESNPSLQLCSGTLPTEPLCQQFCPLRPSV